jgi:hypothetical protein
MGVIDRGLLSHAGLDDETLVFVDGAWLSSDWDSAVPARGFDCCEAA